MEDFTDEFRGCVRDLVVVFTRDVRALTPEQTTERDALVDGLIYDVTFLLDPNRLMVKASHARQEG